MNKAENVTRRSEAFQHFEYSGMIGHEYKWYVLKVKSQHELKVLEYCRSLAIESYLPMRKSLRVWSDRKKWLNLPMFPGYLFIYASCREFFRALSYSSIYDYVRFDGIAATLTESQIDSIRVIEGCDLESVENAHCLTCNDRVRIIAGPLKGIEGIIVMKDNRTYFTLDLQGIEQSFRIRISHKELIKI